MPDNQGKIPAPSEIHSKVKAVEGKPLGAGGNGMDAGKVTQDSPNEEENRLFANQYKRINRLHNVLHYVVIFWILFLTLLGVAFISTITIHKLTSFSWLPDEDIDTLTTSFLSIVITVAGVLVLKFLDSYITEPTRK